MLFPLFSLWPFPFSKAGSVIGSIRPGRDIVSIRSITLSSSISTALLMFSPKGERRIEKKMIKALLLIAAASLKF
jgi:hypothetical protein